MIKTVLDWLVSLILFVSMIEYNITPGCKRLYRLLGMVMHPLPSPRHEYNSQTHLSSHV